MKRIIFPAGALLLGAFMFFHAGNDLARSVARLWAPPDETAWLRWEFGARGEQLRQLVEMQAGYRRRSAAVVQEVEEASRRLAAGLDRSGALTAALKGELATLESARARAHEMALEHCLEVARVLGPSQGPRYLHEMERVLIGLAPRHHSGVILATRLP